MELAKIEELLNKYWDGETSVHEEKILKEYFNSNNVAEHLKPYTGLFGYFKESKDESLQLDIQLPVENKVKNKTWISAVASIILLFGLFFGKQEYDKHLQRKQFAQIKEALELVSFNLNKGNDAIYTVSDNLLKCSHAVTKLDRYEKTVNSVLNKINY